MKRKIQNPFLQVEEFLMNDLKCKIRIANITTTEIKEKFIRYFSSGLNKSMMGSLANASNVLVMLENGTRITYEKYEKVMSVLQLDPCVIREIKYQRCNNE